MRYREPVLHVALLLAASLACGTPPKDRPKGPPIVVSAVDLTRDYAKGGKDGDAKWAGKDIKVTGVAYITMDCAENAVVRALEGRHEPSEVHCLRLEGYDRGGGQALLWVVAWLAPQATKQIQPMTPVTLQCHVPEDGAAHSDLDVSVQECLVLSSGAPSASGVPKTPPPVRGPARPPPPRKR